MPDLMTALRGFLAAVVLLAVAPAGTHAAWTPPASLSAPGQALYGSPVHAAIRPDGTVFATWEAVLSGEPGGSGPKSLQVAQITPAGVVGVPVTLGPPLPNYSIRSISAGPDGSVVVAWIGSDGITRSVQAVRIAPDGTIGSVRTLFSSARRIVELQVLVGSDGQATAVWTCEPDLSAGYDYIIQAARLRPDGSTSAPQTIGSGSNVDAAIQPDGTVLVTWSGTSVTTLSRDGAQGPILELDPGQLTDSVASVAIARTGEGALAWRRNSGETMTRRVQADASLGSVVRLSPDGQYGRSEPVVGVSPSGLATVAWSDDNDVWLAQTAGSGVTRSALGLNIPGGSSNQQHGIAVDGTGTSTLTWIDEAGNGDSANWRVRAITVPVNGPSATSIISGADQPRGETSALVDDQGTVTAIWQTFPGGTNPAVRMARFEATPPPDPQPTCDGLELIGARGVGEKKSDYKAWGNRAEVFRAALVKGLGPLGRKAKQFGLPYNPLKEVTADLQGSESKYLQSETEGYSILLKHLKEAPKQRCFVLVGYSEGAHVVGDVLEIGLSKAVRRRIIAGALLADPAFDPIDKSVQRYGSFEQSRRGYFPARMRGAMAKDGVKVLSACKKGDLFCQYGADFVNGVAIHSTYSGWATNLAGIVVGLVQQRFNDG